MINTITNNIISQDLLFEHLSKAQAMVRTAAHNDNFAELAPMIIHNYLWALEQHIQIAIDSYQNIFKK